jgi:leader peptidase (prepilin peptidase)/N-methyltransferase
MIVTLLYLFIFLLGLCWGSFLNVVACRLLSEQNFFTQRSYCPSCKSLIFWYDNLPVISWFLLLRKCRSCKTPISKLYPTIELLTGVLCVLAVYFFYNTTYLTLENSSFLSLLSSIPASFIPYLIFLSALIVGIRTDLQALVIPQVATLHLIPVGVLCSLGGFIPIHYIESLSAAFLGYYLLWSVAKIFLWATKKNGLGVGDMELLAMIGSFLGPYGIWTSLLLGSFSGLSIGLLYLTITKKDHSTRIPFGPFLTFGALVYFFFEKTIIRLIFL